MDREKLQAFIDDLTALSKKHGFSIHGACCDSPWIQVYTPGDAYRLYSMDFSDGVAKRDVVVLGWK
jgi:hypothetical protein